MRDLSAERQASYRQLADIAGRFVAEGRSTRSAGLKPAMQFSQEGFDENRLGFRSFRAFLEAAAEAGYVVLRPAPTGPDVDVLPASTTPAAAAEGQIGRIRRDLWAAFVDWNADWRRFYDRETGQVAWLPTFEQPDEGEPYASVREAVAAGERRYLTIEPGSQDATLAWMKEFIEELDPPERGALQAAMASARPIRAFVLAARESGLEDRWRAWRLERVRGRINDWAAENELEVDLTVERPPLSPPPPRRPVYPVGLRPPPRGTPGRGIPLEELRERVCAAVHRMSRGELLQLAIPLEYVLDDDGR